MSPIPEIPEICLTKNSGFETFDVEFKVSEIKNKKRFWQKYAKLWVFYVLRKYLYTREMVCYKPSNDCQNREVDMVQFTGKFVLFSKLFVLVALIFGGLATTSQFTGSENLGATALLEERQNMAEGEGLRKL